MKALIGTWMSLALLVAPMHSIAEAHPPETLAGTISVTDEGYKVNVNTARVEEMFRELRGSVSREEIIKSIQALVFRKLEATFPNPDVLSPEQLVIIINCKTIRSRPYIDCEIIVRF